MFDILAKTPQPSETATKDLAESRDSDWTMSAVAELSQADIRQMDGDELIAVIRTADIPLFRERMIRHLPFYDHATLEQLAFLAQRTVRNLGY